MQRIFLALLLVFLLVVTFISCGGGGGGGASPTIPPSSGVEIFASPDNTAFVVVATGTIPSYVNAKNPTLSVVSKLPDGFVIDPTIGDINVTKGGIAYTFNLNGTSGFSTSSDNAITITFPFDKNLVPAVYLTSGLNVLLKIFNPADNSVYDIHGVVNVNDSIGTVTVETKGLPNTFTAAVIYNPNIKAQAITVATMSPTALSPTTLAVTVSPPWPASVWCVYYNPKDNNLIAAVKKQLNTAANVTPEQIDNVVYTSVAQAAEFSQNIYMKAGFRAPNLNSRDEPCGSNLERVPKYRLSLGTYPDYPIADTSHYHTYNNMFGFLAIDENTIGEKPDSTIGSVKARIAHEMLHAIQDGYDFLMDDSTLGYQEGAATIYGKTIDNWPLIKVRSYLPCEIKLLSKPLTVGTVNNNRVTCENYSNQDYFAYVGRQYNSGNLDYLSGLFESILKATGSPHKPNPENQVLYKTMDSYFQTKFKTSLNTIYLDFVRQRAFDHNPSSQFGRSGETTTGFAENLFEDTAIYQISIDPSTCGITDGDGTIIDIPPYSSRAIKILSTSISPVPSGKGVTVKVDLKSTISKLGGFYNYSGITDSLFGVGQSNYLAFGQSGRDKIIMVLSNTDDTNLASYPYKITCDKCDYSISPTSKSISSSSSSDSIQVTASRSCPWTALTNDGWIKVTSGSSGIDNGTVNYTVEANTGTSQRIGNIIVAGLTFTVTQAGTAAGCFDIFDCAANQVCCTGQCRPDPYAGMGVCSTIFTPACTPCKTDNDCRCNGIFCDACEGWAAMSGCFNVCK